MSPKYRNPDGTLSQGYFCLRCGCSCNLFATGHERCPPDSAFVLQLVRANRPEHPVFRVKAGRSVAEPPR